MEFNFSESFRQKCGGNVTNSKLLIGEPDTALPTGTTKDVSILYIPNDQPALR